MGFVDVDPDALRGLVSCTLCKGPFEEVHTIQDCLHSFCFACLVEYWGYVEEEESERLIHHQQDTLRCPSCSAALDADPLYKSITLDCQLQRIADEIHAQLSHSASQRDVEIENAQESKEEVQFTESSKFKMYRREVRFLLFPHPENKLYLPLLLRLTSYSQRKLPKPHIQTSARATMRQVKQYLVKKLDLNEDQCSIELSCSSEVVSDDSHLEYVLRTCWFEPKKTMIMHYRIET